MRTPRFDGPALVTTNDLLMTSRVPARLLTVYQVPGFQKTVSGAGDDMSVGGICDGGDQGFIPQLRLGPVLSDPRGMTLDMVPLPVDTCFLHLHCLLLRCNDRSHEWVMFEGETDKYWTD